MSPIVMPEFSLNVAPFETFPFDSEHFTNVSREDAETLTDTFTSMYQEIHKRRVAVEEILAQGVNLFGISPAITVGMRGFKERLAKGIAGWDSATERVSAPDFMQAMFVQARRVLADLRFLIEVDDIIAEASARPPTPLDPHKSQAAREAFERGETRPLRKDFLTGPR